MSRRFYGVSILCAIIVLTPVAGLPAGDGTARNATGEWVELFDGKTTAGWQRYCGKDFPARCWTIEDGALKRLKDAPERDCGDIMTVGEYGDFEFELDYKISKAGNSGIKYLVPEKKPAGWDRAALEYSIGELKKEAKPGYEKEIAGMTLAEFACSPIGFEYQLIDDVANEDAAVGGSSVTGALYDLLAPSKVVSKPAGEYNHVRLLVRGNHVEHWMNGVKVLEFERDGTQLKQAIERSKFRGMAGFGTISRGHIILQDHDSEVWFKNIRIRELKP